MKTDNFRATAPKNDKAFMDWLRDTATKAKDSSGAKKQMYLSALPLHDVCVYLKEIDIHTLSLLADREIWNMCDFSRVYHEGIEKICRKDNAALSECKHLSSLYHL